MILIWRDGKWNIHLSSIIVGMEMIAGESHVLNQGKINVKRMVISIGGRRLIVL
jgi:hypothetical protein